MIVACRGVLIVIMMAWLNWMAMVEYRKGTKGFCLGSNEALQIALRRGISFPYGVGRYHNISSSSASSPTGFCLSVTQVPMGPVILEKRRVLIEKVGEHSLL